MDSAGRWSDLYNRFEQFRNVSEILARHLQKAVRPELSARFGIEGAASLIDTNINAAAVIWC